MNELDKSFYRALKFLATYTRAKIKSLREDGFKDYDKAVPSTTENPIEQTLVSMNYLNLNGNTKWMITQQGLQQLRDLEEIKRKDLTLIASIIAVIISLVALAKSMAWI